MRLSVRNLFATAAGISALLITLSRFGRFWSQTLIPDCIYPAGQPLWQLLVYPLVPLVAGSLLAGCSFALISSESAGSASVLVGALVVLIPTVSAYMTDLPWPMWWYPFAWVIAIMAGLPAAVAVRGVQTWVHRWRRAT